MTTPGILLDACRCRLSAPCATCNAWRAVFEGVEQRRAHARERAVDERRTRALLARQRDHGQRRLVIAIPRRRPLDLDALADAVALRLGSAP